MSRKTTLQRGEPGIYLVTVQAPGLLIRLATSQCSVPYVDGDGPLHYWGGVQIEDFAAEVDYMATNGLGSVVQAQVQAVLPPDLDPAVLEMTGYLLSAATAEVALWWPDDDWTLRRVVVVGKVQLAALGRVNEPIRFVVESIPASEGSASVGDADRDIQIEYDTLRTIPTDLSGRQFPVILGRCYRIPGFKVGDSGTADELVLCGHSLHDTSTVVVVYGDGAALAPAHDTPVNTTSDEGGRVCVLQDTTAPRNYFSGSTLAFTFDAMGGGIRAVEGGGATLDLADSLHWLLANSGEVVDWPRMRGTLERLRGWRGGVYTDQETAMIDVIQERLLPYLPLVAMQSNVGLWYAYIDLAELRVEADLTVPTHLLGSIGGLQIGDTSKCYSRFILNYFYDHFFGRYMKSVTVDETNNPLCFWSKEAYGERVAPALSWNCTWDEATAKRALVAIANRNALPTIRIDYQYDPLACPLLREGMIVRLTDADFGLSERVAYVQSVGLSTNPPTCKIALFPRSPVRDGRI